MRKRKYFLNSLLMQMIVIGLIFVIVLCGSYLGSIKYAEKENRKNTLEHNEVLMEQTAERIAEYRNNFYNAASVFCQSPTVLHYISETEKERVDSAEDIKTAFSNAMLLEQDIQNMVLYDAEIKEIANLGRVFDIPFNRLYMRPRMQLNTDYLKTPYGTEELCLEIFYPIYDLTSVNYQEKLGLCVFVAEKEVFDQSLSSANVTEHAKVFLLDDEERVISYSGDDEDADSLEKFRKDSGYYVKENALADDGWKLVSVIPKEDLVYTDSSVQKMSGMVFITALILFIMLILYHYQRVIHPLEEISHFISGTIKNPGVRLKNERKDEIGHVARSLDKMLDDNQEMQKKVYESQKKTYEAEIAQQQAELLAYRTQITPHFLYNTFACICEMAVCYDVDDIAEITRALSNVFRFAVKGDDMVAVKDEMKYVREYAKIIQYRFQGKITIHIECPEELSECRIIKLLLQPLVENAVFHGLEPKSGPGEVFVSVRKCEEGKLCFFVRDTGCGMIAEKLQEVREQLEMEHKQKGVGLSNIYRRLKLYYKQDFKFQINSIYGTGTSIAITIPYEVCREEKEEC